MLLRLGGPNSGEQVSFSFHAQLLRQLLQPCWEGMVLGDWACWSGARLVAAFPSARSSPRNIALLLARQPPPQQAPPRLV